MKSKRSLEGYLMIDNRHAPPVDLATAAAFERATGHQVVGAGLRGLFEAAILTCSHCQRGLVENPQRTRPRNWCSRCDKYICDTCVSSDCRPLRALMDEARRKELPLITLT
jgi:hypothetical protein